MAGPRSRRRSRGAGTATGNLPGEWEMEEDTYAKERERGRFKEVLHMDDGEEKEDAEDDDDDLDAAVYNLDDEEEDEGEEEEDEEDAYDSDEEAELSGRLGELARQSKKIKQQLLVDRGGGSSDEEGGDDGKEEKGRAGWGRNSRVYYGGDDLETELTDDEEAPKHEEQEARMLEQQRASKLRMEDFGLDDLEEEDGEEEEEEEDDDDGDEVGRERTLGEEAGVGRSRLRGKKGVDMERVAKDLGSWTAKQKEEAVMADAPELLALLSEMKGSLEELRSRIQPLLEQVKEGGLATAEGVSYLEAKNLLLLSYCQSIVFYLLLKAEGLPVRDHPVIPRLVQVRAYLEKLRPVDAKLKHQMDKLLLAVQKTKMHQAAEPGTDALQFRPNPAALLPVGAAGGGADEAQAASEQPNGGGPYRPPKLMPAAMPGEDAGDSKRKNRREAAAQKRAARSAVLAEMEAEIAGRPAEVKAAGAPLTQHQSAEALYARARLEARAEVEEELFTRFTPSKEERKRLKAAQKRGLAAPGLDDFADDVSGLVEMAGDGGLASRHRLNQRFGADLDVQERQQRSRSGDDDLPAKAPLHERRARYDAVRAAQAARRDAAEAEAAEAAAARKRPREEDSFYRQTQALQVAKKKGLKERLAPPRANPPLPDEAASGSRAISSAIQQNRGLTPHRKKAIKNPRKHARIKFQSAEKRRKGQVVQVRTGDGNYGGETTGVRSKISRSVRIRS